MIGPVPLKVDLGADESLLGYLARLAERNFYDRATWIPQELGSRVFDPTRWDDVTLAGLAQLTGLPIGVVESRSYGPLSGGHRYFGTTVPRNLLKVARQRCCPRCLDEDGYQSALFDLTLIDVCPRHACRLVSKCPACSIALRWGRPGVTTCGVCGYDLRRAASDEIGPWHTMGLAGLAARAGFSYRHPSIEPDMIEPASALNHLTLGEFAELQIGLAYYRQGRSTSGSFLGISPEDRPNLHFTLDLGWRYIRHWPLSLFELLDQTATRRQTTHGGYFGLGNPYGPLYAMVAQEKREPWITVAKAIISHLTFASDIDAVPRHDGRIYGPEDMHRLKRVTQSEVGRRTGLAFPKVKALLANADLTHERAGEWHGAPIFVNQRDLNRIAPQGKPPLDLANVGARLGLTRQRTRKLLDAGAIKPILGPQVDGSKTYLFAAADIDGILTDITSHLRAGASSGATRDFSSVMHGAEALDVPLGALLAGMRAGRPPAVAVDPTQTGLLTFNFEAAAARHFLTQLSLKPAAASVSVAAAAKTLTIGTQSVLWLSSVGLLQKAGDTAAITATSLHSLQHDLVKLGHLADEHGTARKLVKAGLAKAGVEPAADPSTSRYGVTFYRRADLVSLNMVAVLAAAAISKGRSAEYHRERRARKKIETQPI